MKIIVRDRNVDLIAAFKETIKDASLDDNFLRGCPISFEVGEILSEPAEALVSPANSFGFMDGGIDRVYCDNIGWHLQTDVQAAIKAKYRYNELLVGDALAIATNDARFPYLIAAPTMRMPRIIPVDNVFLATRAATDLALQLNVSSLLFPGMGTGTGRVGPKDAATAMLLGMMAAIDFHKAMK